MGSVLPSPSNTSSRHSWERYWDHHGAGARYRSGIRCSHLAPLTYVFDPLTGMIVISGMFYGIMYGGSTTSVLLNIPGDAPSVVSAFEGYPLARAGRAGPALGITAIASFIGGTGSVIVVSMVAAPVAQVAVVFGSAEYFALTLGGLLVLARIMGGSLTAGLLPLSFGLLLGCLVKTQSAARHVYLRCPRSHRCQHCRARGWPLD